jgi:hypothetical protein
VAPQKLCRFCLSTNLWVKALKSDCGTRLVPMSALLFSVLILTNMQLVRDFVFDPAVNSFNVFEVSGHVRDIRGENTRCVVLVGVVSWIQPMVFRIPLTRWEKNRAKNA